MFNKKVKVKFNSLSIDTVPPEYKSAGASGFDLHTIDEFIIKPKERKLVSTGLSFEIPKGYEIQIRPRSGLASKFGVTVLNSPGTIDSDYRGEVKVLLYNTGNRAVKIGMFDRIAQAVVCPVSQAKLIWAEELEETERGSGGFGSTGR